MTYTAVDVPTDGLLGMYYEMSLIRSFEDATIDMYKKNEIPGIVHSYSGQEGVAVGVCAALSRDDLITSTHRGHGHCLAKGADPTSMLLEIAGKRMGYCGGKGGSMHIFDIDHGILGTNGVVAGGVGIALGAAYAESLRGSKNVVICFIGEGALNQGITFESMNMAALWGVPLLFVCENNQYGQYSHFSEVTSGGIGERAMAFGIPATKVDGMRVERVFSITRDLVSRLREGEGPQFLEADTYRYFGHHVAELNVGYRTGAEIDDWKAKDPIVQLQDLLRDRGVSERRIQEASERAHEIVSNARSAALAAKEPELDDLSRHVFAPDSGG